jgi:acetolactate synthase-1/2/3 large subunit
VPTTPRADPAAVATVAKLLAKASFPLVIAGAPGFDPAVPALLGEVARSYGAGVVERVARAMNLADDHPNHLGHRPEAALADADIVVILECDVPWFPGAVSPRPDATIVHVGVDPAFGGYPLRTHRADLAVTADPAAFLADLLAAVPARVPKRTARLAEFRAANRRALQAEVDADDRSEQLTKVTLMRELAAAIDGDTVVVNEYPLARDHLPRTRPGTWFHHSPAAGLGWGLPAALGVQHARPGATVVAAVGDGAYLFANPAACHHAAAAHGLPVVTVIATNRRWDAVSWSTLGLYPEGHAASARAQGGMPLVSLDPVPDFARYSEASGGWGARVDHRADLGPALSEALRVARTERRQALVDVRCA